MIQTQKYTHTHIYTHKHMKIIIFIFFCNFVYIGLYIREVIKYIPLISQFFFTLKNFSFAFFQSLLDSMILDFDILIGLWFHVAISSQTRPKHGNGKTLKKYNYNTCFSLSNEHDSNLKPMTCFFFVSLF